MPKALDAQRDFRGGELDLSVKRADQDHEVAALLRSGLRSAPNTRILNSGASQNRPGRRMVQLLGAGGNRTEEVLMSPGNVFRLLFQEHTLAVYDLSGTLVFSNNALPRWISAGLKDIVWAQFRKEVYIGWVGTPTLVLAWDGAAGWSLNVHTLQVTPGNQKRTLFYRLSPLGVTMAPSAASGNITMTFNPPVTSFAANMVGTIMRFCGRQIRVSAFVSTAVLNGTVLEVLPPAQDLTTTPTLYNLGDEVIGQTTGARGVVTAIGGASIRVQLLSVAGSSTPATGATHRDETTVASVGFAINEVVAGPGGSSTVTAVGIAAPQPVTVWDEELMNDFRGWPQSVFSDQGRLGLCNFPALPKAVAWSAYGAPTDFYVDGQPSNAMLELVGENVQVLFVKAGMEGSEFVFCDTRIYYIPITPTNPLTPGRVAFNILSGSGCAQVEPRVVEELMIYIDSGSNCVMGIVAPGAYYRPYGTHNLSHDRSHLIGNPVAIVAPSAQGTFEEQYIYVLNDDGTVVVGKYEVETGQIKGVVGWVPWSGAGTVQWISARYQTVMFTTVYPGDAVVELLDDTLYLDAGEFVNALPTALQPPPGLGPLFWMAGGTCTLMDQGTRMLGTFQVDANGFIIPQNIGEDLTAPTLVAGQPWTAIWEPFVPAAPTGQDQHQRMTRRRVPRVQVYVSGSSGFVFRRYSTEQGALLPAPGTPMVDRRVPAWNIDDNAMLPPPLRERAYSFRPLGRAWDPRVAIVKDTPGPLMLHEMGFEVTA